MILGAFRNKVLELCKSSSGSLRCFFFFKGGGCRGLAVVGCFACFFFFFKFKGAAGGLAVVGW